MDAKMELVEDSGIIDGKDGLQHSAKLFRIQIASPVSRFHSETFYVIAVFNSKGGAMAGDRVAMRSEPRAKATYMNFVRDAKYGELNK